MPGEKSEVRKLTEDRSGTRIVKKVWIKASPKVVFSALTHSRDLVNWFCDRASCDAREGGELVAHWRTGKSIRKGRAVLTRVVPNSLVELQWMDEGSGVQDKKDHTLVYEIRSKSGLTELVMTDRDDAAADQDAFSVLDQGWNSVLLELKDYCERKERSAKSKPRLDSSDAFH